MISANMNENFLASEINNTFLLYTLLEKYICKDIGSDARLMLQICRFNK